MAKEIKVKPDFATKEVGFLGKFGPLGEMPADDMAKYYAMVKHHGIEEDLAMFEVGEHAAAPAAAVPQVELAAPAPKRKVPSKKKAAEKLHKQTPATPEAKAATHIANENGGGNPAPVSTNVTDNTAITPEVAPAQ